MNKLLIALICATSMCASANAEIVKYKYTGIVAGAFTENQDGFSPGVRIDGYEIMDGYSVEGTVSYDTLNPFWFSSRYQFVYYQGFGEITATVLENDFSIGTTSADHHQMSVANNTPLYNMGSTDVFGVQANSSDANGVLTRAIVLSLFDHTGEAFTEDSLPKQLDLSHFQQKDLIVYYPVDDYWTQFTVNIDSLVRVHDVPEPASGALLFAGLGLLLGVRRFSSRRISRSA